MNIVWRCNIFYFVRFTHSLLTQAGKYAVFEAVKLLDGLTWGVAGRNEEKLKLVLKEMGDKAGKDLSATPIIIADVNDESSLVKMAEKAKVSFFGSIQFKIFGICILSNFTFIQIIVNTVGPYRFYGRSVVEAWYLSFYCFMTYDMHWVVSYVFTFSFW